MLHGDVEDRLHTSYNVPTAFYGFLTRIFERILVPVPFVDASINLSPACARVGMGVEQGKNLRWWKAFSAGKISLRPG